MALNDELAADMIGDHAGIQGAISDIERGVLGILRDLQDDLTLKLANAPELSEAGRRSTKNLLRAVNEAINEKMAIAELISDEQLADFAEQSSLDFTDSLEQHVPGWSPNSLSATELKSAAAGNAINGTPTRDWWKTQTAEARTAFNRKINAGVMDGLTNNQIVRSILGTKAQAFKDGSMKKIRRDTLGLVRTSALNVSNKARQATYEKNQDIIKGVRHLSTLDGRTSDICKARSGVTYKLVDGDYLPDGHSFPFSGGSPYHRLCRSAIVPITRSFAELSKSTDPKVKAKLEKFKPSVSTQASMDGQAPANLTWDEWADRKGDDFLDETLGKGKAKLYKDDQITMRDLIDRNGRIRSLSELRDLKR